MHPGDPYTKALDVIPIHQMSLIPLEAENMIENDPNCMMIYDTTDDVGEPLDPKVLKKNPRDVSWKDAIKQKDKNRQTRMQAQPNGPIFP